MPDGRFREETESGAGQAPGTPDSGGRRVGVTAPEAGELVDGDLFTAGDSYARASGLDEVPDLPEECAPEGEFVTINQGSLKKGPYGEDSP